VTLWNPKNADVVATFPGHEDRTLSIAFSADGKTLYTSSLDGAIFEWDLGGARRFGRPFEIPGSEAATQDPSLPSLPPLALSPDGTHFATRIGTSMVGIYSLRTLRRVRSFAFGEPITTLAWSPARNQLAVAGSSGRVQLWSVGGARPRLVRTFERLRGGTKLPTTVNAVAFSPSGALVGAVASNQVSPGPKPAIGLAGVWRTSAGKLLWKRVHRQGPADALAFSRDGDHLALSFEVGPSGGLDELVSPSTGRTERSLRPMGASQSLAFAPDGTLATGAWSGIVQRWDVSSGRQLGHPLLALPAPVATISFDPSGSEFATAGGSGGFVKLWDTKTFQQLGSAFPGSPGQWVSAQFTNDGSKLVTLYQDGRGAVWPGTLGAWEEHACRVAGRDFTREEWSRYVTGRSYDETCS
jgi:WD40 repeat protein